MKNVIDALRYMAKNGGLWSNDPVAGVWRLRLFYARSYSGDRVGFTQSDLREFLEHYEEIMTENQDI